MLRNGDASPVVTRAASAGAGHPSSVPVVLVGGPARSGTTLMADILNEQDDVGVLAELYFGDFLATLEGLFDFERALAPLKAAKDAGGSPGEAPIVGMRYTPQEHFVERRHHRRFPHREDFPRLACRLVGEILDKPNLRLIGCKTPNFAERYRSGEIEAVFPNTRLLFIVRNPRDSRTPA